MRSTSWADQLWGKEAKFFYLILSAIILLFGFLGSRELWTQEHRWADIVTSMFFYHDFLHPILNGQEYYDKPLLSYWFIAGLSAITGQFSLLTMRLPSALAGLLAIWSIYRLGVVLQDRRLGLLAGWLLLTTYYFVFWARVSSTDMLNLSGSLFAVSWYFTKRNHLSFFNYLIFFIILAITALCKGLVGPVVAGIAVATDVFLQKSWKKHFNLSLFLGMAPAIILYVLPFWFSNQFGNGSYEQNGLYEVYRENIMRYFYPFDHKDPVYTYFIYLPIYLLPWAFFFIPAIFSLKNRWLQLSLNAKWMVWTTWVLFLFFTLSGSRRSYYILPMIPYAILMTADWILSGLGTLQRRAGAAVVGTFILFVFIFLLLQPLYYARGGVITFDTVLKTETNKIKPWSEWRIVLLDAESKLNFYLKLSPDIVNLDTKIPREKYTIENMLREWPILTNQPKDTIIITRKLHEPLLRQILQDYTVVESEKTYLELILKKPDPNLPLAFIPKG